MNGITVVAEHLCRVVELDELITVGIFVTLLCIGALWFYWFSYKHCNPDRKEKFTLLVCSICIIILDVYLWVFQTNKYNTTHMEYTVVVDNTVSLNDFCEQYEIVSMNGNEFRVIEK